jgi:hypothetical protein
MFLTAEKCKNYLILNQLILLSVEMIIGWILSLCFEGKSITLEYMIAYKFTILSLVVGSIAGFIIGHLLCCPLNKRQKPFSGGGVFIVSGFLIFFKLQSISSILLFAIFYGFIRGLIGCGLIEYLSDLLLKKKST